MFTEAERRELLEAARDALTAHVRGAARPPPRLAGGEALRRPAGAFVTLRIGRELRGCIGRTSASEPVVDVVRAMAVAAASEDPRFPPLRAEELEHVRIEVSVLGPLEPCTAEGVEPGRDGLVVEGFGRRGLLLPEVATDHGWDRAAFIRGTCRKAGLPLDAVERGATLKRFRTEHFEEGE